VSPPPAPTFYQPVGITGNEDFGDLSMLRSILRYQVDAIRSHDGEFLGKGSFGRVTLGKDPRRPERKIAVKRTSSAHHRKNFIREVENLAKLRHPCVIRIYGWAPVDSSTFEIQMQYAAKGDLSTHLVDRESRSRSFGDDTRKAQLICDIVLGMRYMHSHHIIHRDLKPANILLDENWRGLIGDLGSSRSGLAEGPPTAESFTLFYAAPEQLIPHRQYGEKVDVFAFGLVVYEIVGDVAVFEGSRPEKMRYIPIHTRFGPVMQELIPRCWSEDPEARPSFQDIFETFVSCGFAILPDADATAISQAVSKVLQVENALLKDQ
jgi:serine/threonine protein kinase